MTKCEFCNKQIDADIPKEVKAFCNMNCLYENNNAFFRYNIDEYIDEHIHEIVKQNLDIARDYMHE